MASAPSRSATVPNAMIIDPNYHTVLAAYDPKNGFLSARSTAVAMVSKFIVANKLVANPQNATDKQLYNMITANNSTAALAAIAAAIPVATKNASQTITPPTPMQQNSNYPALVAAYNPAKGFEAARGNVMNIISNFMTANNVAGNIQYATDAQLYSIFTAPNNSAAIALINAIPEVATKSSTIMDMTKHELYNNVISAYNPTTGFGKNRNDAINIVNNYMAAHMLAGDPQTVSDQQLYKVLTASSNPMALALIASTIPPTSMQTDPNFSMVMGTYTSANGFGAMRNTAIVIVAKFMSANKISKNAQAYSDKQLYTILTAPSARQALILIG